MKKLCGKLPFYLIPAVGFYLLPFLIRDTGSGMLVLLIILPLLCFLGGVMYGCKNGFSPLFALISAVLFLPSVFLFYNATAWIYAPVFGGITLIGNLLALPFRKR